MTVDTLVPAPAEWSFPNPPVNHPWHLFYIEAEVNPDERESTVMAWLVSAQSESIDKAEQLAKAAVLDDDRYPSEDVDTLATCGIMLCEYVNTGDEDVFRFIGEVNPQ